MPYLRVAAAQLNLTVGDLEGNTARMLDAYDQAAAAGADLVAFPELAVTGYPPEDLLLRRAFVGQAQDALAKLAARTGRTAAIVGFPELDGALYNSAAVCAHGQVLGVYRKHLLPNYAVFDEERYFEPWPGDGPLFRIAGARVAVTVCEDAWSETGPIRTQAQSGAELVVNINASPYYAGRLGERERMLAERATDAGVPVLYVNLVGGQDELVFDGASMVIDATGAVLARAVQFEDALLVVDLLVPERKTSGPVLSEVEVCAVEDHDGTAVPAIAPALEPVPEVYEALVVGTRDYVRKNGFTEAVIGLSGGIDSALVAAIATDALGPENVVGVMMPSRFSSGGSVTDSEDLAANLGIRTLTIPIEPAHQAFLDMLTEPFAGLDPGLAEENVQARVRGTILMTLSNKLGWLVLTTGNKSEMAVGYATLYGDMAGGFAVVKDVPKLLVYALCRDRNARAGRVVIPTSIIDKPPSAELRPDQLDIDSLPAYEVLDPIIEGYVEDDKSIADLEAEAHDPETVRRVAALIDRNEYKRRQAPPGVRVSPKAFGKDRRLPITNRWPG
ncbi:MAG TPA: NAD+ synthase [Acidimicrobiia bacterium]|nr:NAD+ synthase [Acidimicrobiia bacterium]